MAQLVELFIYSKKMKTKDGKKFTRYSTRYNFKNEDGKREPHYAQVKFTDEAFKGSSVQLDDIKRGLLVVDGNQVGIDDVWKVERDEKTGKEKYPICWIRGGIQSFTPVVKEHEFHFDTSDVISEEAEAPEEVENIDEE